MKHKSRAKKKNPRLLIITYSFIFAGIFLLISFVYSFLPFRTSVCANSISCEKSLELKVENGSTGFFNNKRIIAPAIDLSKGVPQNVLGTTSGSGEKHIYVDLTKQTLYAFQGKNLFMEARISSGKWSPTPTGDFRIWVKLRSTRMTGGSGDDFYDLPNVPFVMFFYNDQIDKGRGFSLHGAYWHNNFGHPMSHGCVNMMISDAEKLYGWVEPVADGNITYADDKNPGTEVTVLGEAPL